jgi:nucleoside phosphorylase
MPSVSDLIDKIENFDTKTQREQIKLICYFYCVVEGKEDFNYAQIRKCFDDEDLRMPANISHELNQLAKGKLPTLLKKQKGFYTFHRASKKALDEHLGLKKLPTTQPENLDIPSSDNSKAVTQLSYIGVITASPDEFASIRSLLIDVKQVQTSDVNDSVSYYTGILRGVGKEFSIILPYPLDMGISSAVVLTTKIITNFHPKYLFMVGIAAGNKKINNIGDILIAEKSLNYNEVVEVEKKDKTTSRKFMQNPDSINKHLKTQLSQFSNSDHIKEIESAYAEKDKIEKRLKCSIGLMVTGSSLVRSQSKVEEINETYLNVIGLDMETHGFYYASAHNLKQMSPYFASIKAVSDFGDNTEHKMTSSQRKSYALHTSSNAFKHFVLNYLPV